MKKIWRENERWTVNGKKKFVRSILKGTLSSLAEMFLNPLVIFFWGGGEEGGELLLQDLSSTGKINISASTTTFSNWFFTMLALISVSKKNHSNLKWKYLEQSIFYYFTLYRALSAYNNLRFFQTSLLHKLEL